MKIQENKREKYEKYVRINDDPYSKAVVDAGEAFGTAVDDGKSFEEAEKVMLAKEEGMTGYMVGAAMSALGEFHIRGQEIRDWWNAKYNVSAGETGTVNPAIITIKVKE